MDYPLKIWNQHTFQVSLLRKCVGSRISQFTYLGKSFNFLCFLIYKGTLPDKIRLINVKVLLNYTNLLKNDPEEMLIIKYPLRQ